MKIKKTSESCCLNSMSKFEASFRFEMGDDDDDDDESNNIYAESKTNAAATSPGRRSKSYRDKLDLFAYFSDFTCDDFSDSSSSFSIGSISRKTSKRNSEEEEENKDSEETSSDWIIFKNTSKFDLPNFSAISEQLFL